MLKTKLLVKKLKEILTSSCVGHVHRVPYVSNVDLYSAIEQIEIYRYSQTVKKIYEEEHASPSTTPHHTILHQGRDNIFGNLRLISYFQREIS